MSKLQSTLIFRAAKNLMEYRRLKRLHGSGEGLQQSYPAYVINLERAGERRQYITSHLISLGIKPTLIAAFDGKKMSMDEVVASGKYDDGVSRKTFDRSLSLAEIGCALSHISIYQAMVRDGTPVALVTEDDAQFAPDASERIRSLIDNAPADWELIQLRFDTRDFDAVGSNLVSFRFEDLPVAATSYLIKLSAARKLCDNVFPVRYPADSLLGRANQWGVRIYGAWPELVGVNNVFPSAIQGKRNSRFRLSNFAKHVILKIVG